MEIKIDSTAYGIDDIIRSLNWNCSAEEQENGLSLAMQVKSLKVFFRPMESFAGKPVWENCATVICSKSDETLEPYIWDMLLWLQDLNWPGAEAILWRLANFSSTAKLQAVLSKLIPFIEFSKDAIWAKWIIMLIDHSTLKNELPASQIDSIRALSLSDE